MKCFMHDTASTRVSQNASNKFGVKSGDTNTKTNEREEPIPAFMKAITFFQSQSDTSSHHDDVSFMASENIKDLSARSGNQYK
jgi:hypothetical protein